MRRFLLIIFILTLLLSLLYYMVNIFLPARIEQETVRFIKNSLGKEIRISRVNIDVFKGIYFKDIRVYEEDTGILYLEIGQLKLVPFLLTSIPKKKLISSLYIENAYFNLKRNENKELNLPSLDVFVRNSPILVKKVSVNNLTLDYEEKKEDFKQRFNGIEFVGDFSLSGVLKLKLDWQDNLACRAEYRLTTRDLDADILLRDIDLSGFKPLLKNTGFRKGLVKKAKISLSGKKIYSLKMESIIEDFSLVKEDVEINGDLDLFCDMTYSKENTLYDVRGDIHNGRINGVFYVGNLSEVNGHFNLDKEALNIRSLQARIGGHKIKARGKVSADSLRSFLFKVYINLPLAQFVDLLKYARPFSFDYDEGGEISSKFVIKGNLMKKEADYYGTYDIDKASLGKLNDIRIKGTLSKNRLTVKEGSFDYMGMPIEIEGILNDFTCPDLTFFLGNSLWQVDVNAKCNKDKITLSKLLLRGKQTNILSKASIEIKKEPLLKVEGDGVLSLGEACNMLKLFKLNCPVLTKLNPQGLLQIKFKACGGLDISKWEVKLIGQSPNVQAYNLSGKITQLDLYKDRDKFTVSPLVAQLQEGMMDFRVRLDFLNNSGLVNLILNDIDLSRIREQLALSCKELAGLMSFEGYIKTDDLSRWDNLKGTGKVLVKNGFIWEMSLLKGLGEILFIPDYDDIEFEEGYSDLILEDNNIIFENLELNSWKMDLIGAGKISLKGDAHFMLFPEFNPKLIAVSDGLRKVTTEFLGKSGLVIEVKGNIKEQNLTYNMKPLFLSPLKAIKDFFDNLRK